MVGILYTLDERKVTLSSLQNVGAHDYFLNSIRYLPAVCGYIYDGFNDDGIDIVGFQPICR